MYGSGQRVCLGTDHQELTLRAVLAEGVPVGHGLRSAALHVVHLLSLDTV